MKELGQIQPFKLVIKIFILLMVSLVCGVIVPGLFALYDNVFYDNDVAKKLPSYAKEKMNTFNAEKKLLNDLKSDLDYKISHFKSNDYEILTKLIDSRERIMSNLKNLQPPLYCRGFYNFNGLITLWPSLYFFLSCLLFLSSPKPSRVNFKKVFLIAILLHPIYRWTTWYRNLFPNDDIRKIYSINNFDISPVNFWVQEFMALLILTLISFIIYYWVEYFEFRQRELKFEKDIPFDEFSNPSIQNRLSFTFFQWQVASVLLCLAFFSYTKYFWDVVFVSNDKRFIFHAIIMHLIWAIVWIIISLPLIITQFDWFKIKQDLILNSINSDKLVNFEKSISLTKEIEPIGFWNLGISGMASIVSFFYPILNNFF